MQGCDGVHGHNVDRSAASDEALQQAGVALRGRFVHVCPFRPAACGETGASVTGHFLNVFSSDPVNIAQETSRDPLENKKLIYTGK